MLATWATIRGHAWQVARLGDLLRQQALPATLLFSGPPGVGKATVARALFAAMLCENGVGCGRCAPCGKLERGLHPDVFEAAPERDVFPIERVRELRRALALQPWESSYRLVLLDGIERLQEEAANALLKTLEEPPDFARIVLIMSGAGDLLATIDSRCQRMRFGTLALADVLAVLMASGLSAEEAAQLAPLAEGSPGAALAARSELVYRERMIQALLADQGDPSSLFASTLLVDAGDTQQAREAARRGLAWMAALIRDRLVVPLGGTPLTTAPTALLERLPASTEQLLAALEMLQAWHDAAANNVAADLLLQDAGQLLRAAAPVR